MIIYTVANHHWPEELIMKNKDEKRAISELIYRTEGSQQESEKTKG
jgi:hypothetical protein